MTILIAFGSLSLGTTFGWMLHGALMRQVALLREKELYDLYQLDEDDLDDWSSDPEMFGSLPDGLTNERQVKSFT